MKSKEQILLEDAYARTYGIRKVRDSEVEQMIENILEVEQMIKNIKEVQNRAGEMHHLQLKELKQHLEKTSENINSLLLVAKETVAKINSLLEPQAS
jgi:esterase/lipase